MHEHTADEQSVDEQSVDEQRRMSTDDDRAHAPAVEGPDPVPGTVHPWRRYVALGDSFTEGIGDPLPQAPGGHRGWADRVADALAETAPHFAYANLAVRGRLLARILDEQVEPALALQPDLITLSAGGNDVIRPGADPDALAARLAPALARLTDSGATVVLFTGVDVAFSPVFRSIRGRVAIYNEHLRVLAARTGARIADQWGLTAVHDARLWSADRLHLNELGHREIARMVLGVLGVATTIPPAEPGPRVPVPWRSARVDDLVWARDYFAPWVVRRLRGTSSGDHVRPKRPRF
ncbi:SGNH/GDSL hydrolase family protein [uncultured Amnibacterium sp.]|uniref:SGNH/GDSL hydrolase family protein n=1 Tax=uncultured Amnibacterium sp. TaxID=1631851 RepID=UPI0035CAB093